MVWLSSWGLLLECKTDGPLVFILFSSAAPLVKRAGDFIFTLTGLEPDQVTETNITKYDYEGTKKQQMHSRPQDGWCARTLASQWNEG
jgi:hypothetical protein